MRSRVAALAALALCLGACSGGYSDLVRKNFIGSCERTSGGATGSCECMLNEIEERIPDEDEFRELERKGDSVFLVDPRIEAAIAACSSG